VRVCGGRPRRSGWPRKAISTGRPAPPRAARLAAELARSRLAPLDALGPGPRERLAATLRAWLDRPGQVQAVAATLSVHPQTVRYRLKQLRELFGSRLEDPEARFELALALRAADAVRYT
jgi:DNA-binding PucR family transcriptional regulator